MKYDKLVRDKIPEIIEKKGKKAIYRTLNDNEFKEYLEKKLDEEIAEYHESKSLEELCDLWEVLNALICEEQMRGKPFYAEFEKKRKERGAFNDRILLIEVKDDRCKYEVDEICTNADCPCCSDYCPVTDIPEVCKHEERNEK